MSPKEAAYILFLNDIDLKDISTTMKVPYDTIAKWSSKENWKKKRTDQLLREQTNQERILALIDYQLMVIEKIITLKKRELEDISDIDGLKNALINRGDIDALQKLHTTIKAKEISWDQVVKTTRESLEYLEKIDFDIAKKIQPWLNDWLNEKREQL